MLKEQKNALFNTVVDSGLDTSLFIIKEDTASLMWTSPSKLSFTDGFLSIMNLNRRPKEDRETVEISATIISVLNSPMRFIVAEHPYEFEYFMWRYTDFHKSSLSHSSYNRVFQTSSDNPYHIFNWKTFSDLLFIFHDWIDNHARKLIIERSLPDLWSTVNIYSGFASQSGPSKQDTSPFSSDEKIQLRLALQDFKRRIIIEFNPSQEQLDSISSNIDYLAIAVDRLNRFDWKGVAISILTSIAINLTVDTSKAKVLYDLFVKAFRSASHLLQ